MPSHWTQGLRDKRQRVRSLGVCVVCCKDRAETGKTVCTVCRASAVQRVRKLRERRREERLKHAEARMLKTAGDSAFSRFAYIAAYQQYQQALDGPNSDIEREKLLKRMAWCHLHGARPEYAMQWFEKELEQCLAVDALRETAPWVAREIAFYCWIELRTPDALEYLKNAHEISRYIHSGRTRHSFRRKLHTLFARNLTFLGRYAEATTYFSPGNPREPGAQTTSRLIYLNQQAIFYATGGQAEEAFREFDRALEAAKSAPMGGNYLVMILDDYADWAMTLGRLDIARNCYEQALLVARERQISWRIPYFMLRTANLFVRAGNYERARVMLIDSLGYDTKTPLVSVLRSTLALELSHILHNSDLVTRAADDDALELAFRSHEPRHIGPLAAAHVRIAVAAGNLRRAKTLISRTIAGTTTVDACADLFVLAARYGSLADAMYAKDRLTERLKLPNGHVARAYLNLWEAQKALRARSMIQAHRHAEKAARAFGRFGWKHHQMESLQLCGRPLKRGQRATGVSSSLFGKFDSTLTQRERQVAEHVLRGLTNRAIAEILNLSEHTVESHVSSLLGRLGLRSRWQLTRFDED